MMMNFDTGSLLMLNWDSPKKKMERKRNGNKIKVAQKKRMERKVTNRNRMKELERTLTNGYSITIRMKRKATE